MNDLEYGQQLARLIKVNTVTNSGDEAFKALRDELEKIFPLVHKNLERVICGQNALLYKWKGKSSDRPILLMGHQDVVPVVESEWHYPPFGSTIRDGKVYGRGAIDCKNCLYINLKSVEELLYEGYEPEQDIYIAASDNEETMGDGTPSTVKYLKEHNIKPYIVLDEGGAILPEAFPGMDKPYAMIGVLEKGYADVKFTAKSKGGHSSRPPKDTPVARLSKFIAEVEKGKLFKKKMVPQVEEMLYEMSKAMHGPLKFLLGHIKFFKPLVTAVLPKVSPFGNALLSTTCVFTMTGAAKAPNVIPEEAYAIANLRFAPHQGKDECMKLLTDLANKYDIEVELLQGHDAHPPIDTNGEGYKFVVDTIHKVFPEIGVAPYVIMVGTDCRHMQKICDCALRFTPMVYTPEQMNSIHAADENATIEELGKAINFMKELIKDNK